MGFVFPLFLLAGLSLLIPILIHLFNLRKYKKIDFPSLRFLRQFVVQNKKMSKVQKRLLLLSRLLLLLFLVLAFAQPLWNWALKKNQGDTAWVLYIDNSYSMELKEGQQSLLDIAKREASEWIQNNEGNQFYVITNEALHNAQSLSKQEALQSIQKIQYTPISIGALTFSNAAYGLQESLFKKNISIVAFSDFQKNNWTREVAIAAQEGVELLLYPVHLAVDSISNIYIDSAYFLETPMETTQSVPLVTEIKKSGNKAEATTFQMNVNGQVRTSRVLEFSTEDSIQYDTTLVQFPAGKWSEIHLNIQTRAAVFDDDYYMTARIAPNRSVLILNEGASNGYLASAFAAQSGVQPLQRALNSNIENEDNKYSLLVLQGITALSESEGKQVRTVLEQGGSVALFFGKNGNINALNAGLSQIGPIEVLQIDTSLQQIVDLQTSHPLMRDVLVSDPENMQLPYAQYSYKTKAGITAGGQDLMRFRDGSPYISQYNIGTGKLYVFANPLQPAAGNLITSYYFAPLVHRMMVNNSGGDVYAAEIAAHQSLWIPSSVKDDNQVFKLTKEDFESIPRQQSKGMGVTVFVPETLKESGFYTLTNGEPSSNSQVGLNYSREESEIIPATAAALLATFGNENVAVYNRLQQLQNAANGQGAFPFWKIAIILALISIFFETYLLQARARASRTKVETAV